MQATTETLEIDAPEMAVAEPGNRALLDIKPTMIFDQLREGVLGQDKALRYVAVAIYKHTTATMPGNLLMVGNSGTGKTTIMNNIQRLYHEVPEYRAFRAMTVINANLLVDADRMEFRPERLLSAIEQRARAVVGPKPSPEALKEAIERATVCIDEIDKMSSILAGKPNAIGVVLQQGLLTLMEGEQLAFPIWAWVDGQEREVTLDIDTRGMMFICGGAFEGLYDQVYLRVTKPGSGERLKNRTVRTADGQVRIETHFSLAHYLKGKDLFDFGMVPQFMARFEKVVLLEDLHIPVLREILLKAHDSPYSRARRFFEKLGIDLEIEELAAALIAEAAAKDSRTGARALRPIIAELVNPLEFDPWNHDALETQGERPRLCITSDMARAVIR
ncbi:MAG: AAA family ATPase [Acidobacteriota bacterium]